MSCALLSDSYCLLHTHFSNVIVYGLKFLAILSCELERIIVEPSDTRFKLDYEVKHLMISLLCVCSENSNPLAILILLSFRTFCNNQNTYLQIGIDDKTAPI